MRLPVFFWPTPAYLKSRMVPMKWLDIHYIRQNPYGTGKLGPYLPTMTDYLKKLADDVMGFRKGERTLMDWHLFSSNYINPLDTIHRQPADAIVVNGEKTHLNSIWLDHGIKFTREKLDHIFSILKKAGLELDYYTTQHEWSLTPWAMSADQFDSLPKDPRWEKEVDELGFKTLDGVKHFWLSDENRRQLSRFNQFCAYRTFEALEKGVYEILRYYWPSIKITDYSHFAIEPRFECYDINGWPMNTAYNGNPWPGACSDLNYISMGQFAWTAPKHIAPFPNNAWNRFILSLNQARAIKASAGKTPFHPEFAGLTQHKEWGTADFYIWREHIIHATLTGADALQFWNIQIDDNKPIEEVLTFLDDRIKGPVEMHENSKQITWQHKVFKTTGILSNGDKLTRATDQNFNGWWE